MPRALATRSAQHTHELITTRTGSRTPILQALTLPVVVLVAAPLASAVPLAVPEGTPMFVAWNMGAWREFGRLRHCRPQYRTLPVGTFALTGPST